MKNLHSFNEFVNESELNEATDLSDFETLDSITKGNMSGWFSDEPEAIPEWDKHIALVSKYLKGNDKNIVSAQSESDSGAVFIDALWVAEGIEDMVFGLPSGLPGKYISINSMMLPGVTLGADLYEGSLSGIKYAVINDRDTGGSITSVFVKKGDLKKLAAAIKI